MEMATNNSPDVLRQSILADARAEAEKILQAARQEAEAIQAKTAADAEKARQEKLGEARAEAARRRELLLARVPVEAGRRRSTRVEAILLSIHDEARRRLFAREGFDYAQAIPTLAVDALGRMAGVAFTVRFSPGDHRQFAGTFAEEVNRRYGRDTLQLELLEDPSIQEGGIILQDAEGHQVWDNRLATRLERLWPELRLHIATQAGLVPASQAPGGEAETPEMFGGDT